VRLDYLFHKTGALRGKPRGYAFVEYLNDHVSAPAHPLAARDEENKNKNFVLTPGLFFLLYIVLRLCVPHVSFSLHTHRRPGVSSLATSDDYGWVLDADASEHGDCRMLLPRLQLRMGRF
jgi:hypothetical protein